MSQRYTEPDRTGVSADGVRISHTAHHAPACWTVKTCPPMVRVPLRAAPVTLGPTLNSTVPSPDPLAPFVTTIHPTLLTAVHVQPPRAVTATDPDAPPAATI